MDYNTLTSSVTTAGSIANWLNSGQLQSAAPTIVTEAEAIIYRKLRHWRMLVENTTLKTATNVDYVALPDTGNSFLEMKSLYITGVNFKKLTMKTEQEVKAAYSYDGNGNREQAQPSIYYVAVIAIGGSQVPCAKFDTVPDQVYPLETVFYQQPVTIATALTNWLTNLYPRLLRCALMAQASEFMKDAGVGNYDRTYWEQSTLAELQMAQEESDRAMRATEVGMMLV